MILRTPISILFPYTTLFRSRDQNDEGSWGTFDRGCGCLRPRPFGEESQDTRSNRGSNSAPEMGRYSDPDSANRCESSMRSEEHTSELQSPDHLVCRLLLEKK